MGRGVTIRRFALTSAVLISVSGCLPSGGILSKTVTSLLLSTSTPADNLASNTKLPGNRGADWAAAYLNRIDNCTCDQTFSGAAIGSATSPDLTIQNSVANPIAPGALVCIQGQWNNFKIMNLVGTAANPVNITTCGTNTAKIVGSANVSNSHYFRLSGRAAPRGSKFGILLAVNAPGGSHLQIRDKSDHFEFEGLEIDGSGLNTYFGISIFVVVECNDPTTQRNYVTGVGTTVNDPRDVLIHDNYFHNVTGGALLFGHIRPNGDLGGSPVMSGGAGCTSAAFANTTVYPLDYHTVSIYRNRFDHIGAWAIKTGGVIEDQEIFENVVTDYATEMQPAEDFGISAGSRTVGQVFNNIVMHGHYQGAGIMPAGEYTMQVFNNIIFDSGMGGAISIAGYDIGQRNFFVDNNTIVNTAAVPSIVAYPVTGSKFRFTNNLVIGYSGNAFPTASAAITLDGNLAMATPYASAAAFPYLTTAVLPSEFAWVPGPGFSVPFMPTTIVSGITNPLAQAGTAFPTVFPVTYDLGFTSRIDRTKSDIGAFSVHP
jgi:hypothetical protein